MTAEPADPELALRNVALRNLAAIEGARDRADLELRSRTHELAATVALLQATFDAANDAMLATDLRGRATVANQALLELWGLDRGPLFAESADTLAALQARLEWPADFARVGTAGTPRQELRLQSGRTVECSVRPQLIAGAPVGHVWVFRDVTQERLTFAALQHERASAERLNAELERRVQERTEALERLNNNLDAFSYSVSHDLRAPLGAIDGFTTALQESLGDRIGERERHFVSRIRANVQRMGSLIDSLLALARCSNGAVDRREVDLTGMAWSILGDLHDADPMRKVRLDVQDGLRAWADPALLEVVLQNLLRNAWKFSSRAPVCEIQLRLAHGPSDRITFVVEDRGSGFDNAAAGKLFRPFSRLHSESQFAGHGVGLAMVLSVVQRHGGNVWAEGEEGHGARIYVSLPLPPAG
jgi:PAS domain S-box-containing protein